MTHPSKRKGDKYELEAARLLAELTGWPIRRRLGAGRSDDCGDLDGIPDTCIQVKAYRDITRAIRETLDELPQQQTNAGTPFAAGLIRRPGGRWFAVLTPEQLVALIREATHPLSDLLVAKPQSLESLKAWDMTDEEAEAFIQAIHEIT